MSDTNSSTAPKTNGNGQAPPPQSQAIVKGPQLRLNNLKALFEKSKGSIAAVVPKHMTPERLIKIVTSAASRTPDLLDCTQESVLLAVVQAGTLGLEPNTPMHHCALVPYNNRKTGKKEAQLIVEYRGLCQLAYNSGEVLDVYAHEVRENDDFDFEYGTKKVLRHRFDVRKPRGHVIAFYGVVKFKNGGDDFVVMTVDEVNEIREMSPGKDGEAWTKFPVPMGKKTVIRQVLKTAPMSHEKSQALGRALDHETRIDRGDSIDVIDVFGENVDTETGEVTEAKSRTDALKDRVAEKAAS